MFSRHSVILGVASVVCVVTPVRAQQEPERDAMFARYLQLPNLVTGGFVQPRWMADGKSFWYAEGPPKETVIYKVDPVAGTKTPLFDTARLRSALASALGREPPQTGLPFGTFRFTDKTESAVAFTVGSEELVLALNDYTVTRAPSQSEEERRRTTPQPIRRHIFGGPVAEIPSPNGRWFATEKDHGLWLRSAAAGQVVPLVTDGEAGYAWRVEWVEWTIDRAKWSPNSAKLAVFKIDTRQVDSFPEVDWLDVTEEVEWWPAARAGRPKPSVELHIVDVESKKAVRVPTGTDDHYIQTVAWTKDGSELLFLRMDRDYKKLDLMAADAATGKSRVVVSETQKTFVDGAQWRLIQPTFLPDGKRFVWLSERDGWKHLYLYNLDGTLIRRLTHGEWPAASVEGINPAGEWVYFTARAEPRSTDMHVYRVRRDGTGFKRLTEATGQHNATLSPSGQYFLDTHSTPARPETTELRAADGRLILTVATSDTKAFAELKWSPPEEFVVKAADGVTDLHGLLYRPYDFDPGRRYPVVDYIFGSPYFEWVVKTFSTNRQLEAAALAQAGFLVLMVDSRGTPGRGKAFQDAVYKKFGTIQIEDHVATLKNLARERPYMDLRRVGLLGSQWPGSYMAIRGLVTAPDVYCAAVTRLVTLPDLSGMLAVLIEPYMGLPQEDPEAYEMASSLPHISKLKGHLVMIAETDEIQARFSDIMKFVTALNRADKRYDLVLNPERPEGLTYRTYYMNQYRRYLQEYLQGDSACAQASPPRS